MLIIMCAHGTVSLVLAAEGWPWLLYMLYGCCMGKVAVCAVSYSSQNHEWGQLYGRHTAAYSSFFCCIAVWFAVWNDLLYGMYGMCVDLMQVH